MSASREKKTRQERAAQGIQDSKVLRAAEEAAKERRSNRLYAAVAIIFVLVAAALLVWNSRIIQRSSTALTIDGEKYSPAYVGYYYANALSNNVTNSDYKDYFSVDTSKSLKDQYLNDTDMMFLGYYPEDTETKVSWDAYLKEQAKSTMIQVQTMYKKAQADGFKLSEEQQEAYDVLLDNVKMYASLYGYSTEAYLQALYGDEMTLKAFKEIMMQYTIAMSYQSDYAVKLNYTDAQLEQYYKENKADFEVGNYEYVYFSGTVANKTDADGKTVEATDEEKAAAKAAAKEKAEEALARYQAGEKLDAIAEDMEGTYQNIERGSHVSSPVGDYVFAEGRQDGDVSVVEYGSTYYVVLFHSTGRNEYNTVNVRHILVSSGADSLDPSSATYEKDAKEAADKARATAEELYKTWKSGAATEDSFAELATEKTADGGSKSNGGLYTQIYKGEMVAEFNDWCFDESRKTGDTDIVDTSYGSHIMYFVGQDEPYWKVQVRTTMLNNDFNSWVEGLVEGVTAEEGSGMKYVG